MAYKYGIDFGTTNSSIAICFSEDDSIHTYVVEMRQKHPVAVLPSIAYVTKDKIYVGDDAKDAFCDPNSNTHGQYIKQIKMQLERKRNNLQYTVDGVTIQGVDIIAEFFRKLRIEAEKHVEYLEIEMDGVVLGVPVAFDEVAKNVLKAALVKAGFYKSEREADLKTQFVSEPLAVAINYGLDLRQDKTVFIFDFGGGTLDVALVNLKKNIENDILHPHEVISKDRLSKAGEEINKLFFKNAILPKYGKSFLCRQFRVNESWSVDELWQWMVNDPVGIQLIDRVEECKIDLSKRAKADFSFIGGNIILDRRVFTKDDFEDAIYDLIDEIEELIDNCLEEAIDKDEIEDEYDIDQVIIAGGSSLIPAVQEILYNHFNKRFSLKEDRPDEVVKKIAKHKNNIDSEVMTSIVRGLARVGYESDNMIEDVVDCDYGIWDSVKNNMIVILEKGTPIRETKFNKANLEGKYRNIKCADEDAAAMDLQVYQRTPDSVNRLGTITIHDLGGFKYRIYMTIDEDCGTLEVMLYDKNRSRWIKIPTKESVFDIN